MSTNPTLDLDRLEAEHFHCQGCDRYWPEKHPYHCNECADSFPCRVLVLVAKARRLDELEEIATMALRLTTHWPRPAEDDGYQLSNHLTGLCLRALEPRQREAIEAALEEPDAD